MNLYASRREAAGVAGVTDEQLRKWLKGQAKVPFIAVAKLCAGKDIDLGWIAGGNRERDIAPADEEHPDWITFPLYTARAAAGSGAVNEAGFPSPGLAFDPALAAHLLNTSPRSLAGLYVAGDSMEPTFGDGDVLIINTSIERISGDAIYVLVVDEGCIVKRITCLTDGRLVLRSDNPNYADETIDPARKSHLTIYGRVVAAVKRL
ncbi:putative phage repressor [Tepidicaulis marinus]|uniref:Putative phage repressor n=1 Tax=Tepidicaulis marinus TaxID=1333998 RepID=A0A081B6G2_9HYPH|nr:S24 family peptidase [Tepidicaulis marinus]GAK43630.1 putative phage repressor [Tepidicaulis marinus]